VTAINSTEAQKRFGYLLDHTRGGEVVVVERYGQPRVVILDIERYRQLVETERELLRARLRAASDEASARAAHLSDAEIDQLIEEARAEVHAERSRR